MDSGSGKGVERAEMGGDEGEVEAVVMMPAWTCGVLRSFLQGGGKSPGVGERFEYAKGLDDGAGSFILAGRF